MTPRARTSALLAAAVFVTGCTGVDGSNPAVDRAEQVREQQYRECIEAGGTGTSCTPPTP